MTITLDIGDNLTGLFAALLVLASCRVLMRLWVDQ